MGEFKIEASDRKPIMLIDDEDDVDSHSDGKSKMDKTKRSKKNRAVSVKSSKSSSSKGTSALGYNPLR